jgi:hypothetical protein
VLLPAIVIGRILAEPGLPAPDVSDPALLLIKRQNVMVGCTPGDAGVPGDAAIDGGDAGADAGLVDAGVGDAGVPDAGGSECMPIMGDAVTLVIKPRVTTTSEGARFAVLLVTPKRPIVEVQADMFGYLAELTAPKTVTKIVEVPDRSLGEVCAGCASNSNDDGCGGDFGSDTPSWDPPGIGDASLGDGALVEEMVGPYQFVRAQPTSTAELAGWLDQLGYEYMADDLAAVAPYIDLGYHVVAIRVAIDAQTDTSLVPVALTWAGSELRIPAALGRGALSPGNVSIYIAADGKYVLPGATIKFAMATGFSSTSYLTRNELVLDQNRPPESDPIAERSYTSDVQEIVTVTEYRHVPVEVPCEDEGGCCRDCSAAPKTRIDLGLVVIAVAFVLRRKRRR